MEYLFDEKDSGFQYEQLPKATHLDAPIRDHNIQVLLGRKPIDDRLSKGRKQGFLHNRKWLEEVLRSEGYSSTFRDIEIGLSRVQKRLLSLNSRKEILPLIEQELKIVKSAYQNFQEQTNSLNLNYTFDLAKFLNVFTKNLHAKLLFQEGVLLTGSDTTKIQSPLWQKTKGKMLAYKYSFENITIHINKYYIIVKEDGDLYIGPRESLLAIADLTCQRQLLRCHSFLGEESQNPVILKLDDLEYIFIWGDSLLESYGNQGYDMISMFEPLCLGALQSSIHDPNWDNKKFLDKMIEDFYEASGQQEDCLDLVAFMMALGLKNPNLIVQAHGLYRIWGHPVVNNIMGLRKLRQYACRTRPFNYHYILMINCIFKEMFCFSYKMKHGNWPKLDVSKLPKHNIIRDAVENNKIISKKDKRYNIYLWKDVKAEKTFQILPKYNLINLLSDKAMSHGISDLYRASNSGSIGKAVERSVLVKWLENKIGDPVKFIDQISEHGFGTEEIVVGVCPKERELKVWARMFGLLTLNKRMYVVLTEAMLAEHILPYFPEITMLDSASKLMKKLYNCTNLSSKERLKFFKTMFVSMDFQKWNSNMRKEETEEIFEFFDGLFGVKNVYTRTHEMFEKSFIYLADGTFIPEFISPRVMKTGDECWTGHLGGLEGLRQKGWTIFTVCIIKSIMEKFKIKYTLLGQGDNQVLILYYDHQLDGITIQNLHQEILDDMEIVFSQIGPPIKPSESWSSSNIFVYGKFTIVNGCPMVNNGKKLCRMMAMSNEGFPTLESSISALSANLTAVCNSSINPVLEYFLYLIQVYNSILIHLHSEYLLEYKNVKHRDYFQIPKNDGGHLKIRCPAVHKIWDNIKNGHCYPLDIISIFPRCLGGYPILLLGSVFTNGFPDPVSENIALLKKLYLTIDNNNKKRIIENILSPSFNPEVSSELICQDPVSLNLLHPSSPKEILKRMVKDYLEKSTWIVNEEFTSFIKLSVERQKDLCDMLITMKPFNPRVAYAIQSATLVGRANQVIGQLEKTNTLISLMNTSTNFKSYSHIQQTEFNYFCSVIFNLLNSNEEIKWNPNNCSREWAQYLRNESWKLPITGVTVAPITEAFVGEVLELDMCDSHSNTDLGYLLIKPTNNASGQDLIENKKIGPHIPYIGSSTSEHIKGSGKELTKISSPVLKNPSELLKLINWGVDQGTNLENLILKLFSSVTNLDPELYIPNEGQISGTLEHRFSDKSTKHSGGVSILYSPATYIHCSTNTLEGFRKMSDNVNLHFQILLSHCLFDFIQRSLEKEELETYHYHIDCRKCIIPIYEGKLEIDTIYESYKFPSIPDNPICWIDKSEILNKLGNESYFKMPRKSLNKDDDPNCVFHQVLGQYCFSLFKFATIETGDLRGISTRGKINFSWLNKINLISLIKNLICWMLGMYMFRLRWSSLMRFEDIDELGMGFFNWVFNIPAHHFNWASNIYLNSSCLDQMRAFFPGLTIPPDVPLSYGKVSQHFKELLLWKITEINNGLDFIEPVDEVWCNIDNNIECHGVFFHLGNSILSRTGQFKTLLYIAKSIKEIMGVANVKSGNNIDIEKLIALYNAIDSKHLKFGYNIDTTNFLKDQKVIWTIRHIDNIAKLSTDFIYDYEENYIVNQDNAYLSDLMRCYKFKNTLITKDKINFDSSVDEIFSSPTREVHETRIGKNPTSAASKLASIYPLIQNVSGTVVCEADGAAGFSFFLSKFPSVKKIYYSSWFKTEDAIDQGAPNFIPSAFVGFPKNREKLMSLNDIRENITDMTHPKFQKLIEYRLRDEEVSLYICDAEGKEFDFYSDLKIIEAALKCSHSIKAGMSLIKCYISNITCLQIIIGIASNYYDEIFLLRSLWSNRGNAEFYLYVKTPKKEPLYYQYDKEIYNGQVMSKHYALSVYSTLVNFSFEIVELSRSTHFVFKRLLNDPYFESFGNNMMTRWFGKPPILFPTQTIENLKKGMAPIRIGRRHRIAGMINLITIKRVKAWSMIWLCGVRLIKAVDLDQILEKCFLIFSFTKKQTWTFYLSESNLVSDSRAKFWKLSTILSKHDLNLCYQISGYVVDNKIPVFQDMSDFEGQLTEDLVPLINLDLFGYKINKLLDDY